MAIVFEEFQGRLGSYTLTILEAENTEEREPIGTAELESDVVIQYGKLERQSHRQILKSYCELSFVDPNLKLHKFFRGGFPVDKYLCEIVGNDLKWKGALVTESRTIPLTERIQKERTVLRFSGGINKEHLSKRTFLPPVVPDRKVIQLHDILRELPFFSLNNPYSDFTENRLVRSNVELEFDGDWRRVEDKDSLDYTNVQSNRRIANPIDLFNGDNPYDAVKKYNSITGTVLYKSLTNGSFVFDDSYLTGVSGTFQRDVSSEAGGYSDYDRDEFINYIQQENIIVEGGSSGVEDLEKSGDIIIKLKEESNISGMSSSSNNNESPNGYKGPNSYENKNFTNLRYDYAGREPSSQTFIAFKGGDTKTINLGSISPTLKLGIVIEFTKVEDSSNHEVTLVYNNSSGDTASISQPEDGDVLYGPKTTEKMDPKAEFKYTGSPSFENIISYKINYIDERGNIVENLIAEAEAEIGSVEAIEIENVIANPGIWYTDNNTIVEGATCDKIRDTILGIENTRASLYKAALEREYRPFGTQTLRGKFLGLYGPEYAHAIEEDDVTAFWIPIGLKCNITTGTTEAALVEMPAHFLA